MMGEKEPGAGAAALLSEYIRINTTNPPGNEAPAAEFFAEQLRLRGLEPKIFSSAPNRANVCARIKGHGKSGRGPLLLLHHMDVVPAEAKDWSKDPFGGEIAGGYVYGRGALDMKCFGIMHLAALDILKDRGIVPDRDLIILAVADEEQEGSFGARWMVENNWDLIAPEIVWDEGGFGLRGFLGEELIFYVSVSEKNALWTRITAAGEAGLGSVPRENNPVEVLTRALYKLSLHNFQQRLTPASAEMLRRLGRTAPFPKSFLLRHAENPMVWPLIRGALSGLPVINAMTRNLVTPTILRAGDKENVIPGRAEVVLDVRLLPDEDPELFFSGLKALLGEKNLSFEFPSDTAMPSVTSHEHPFFENLETVITGAEPGCQISPMLTPGATDSRFFRRRGVSCFGLIPIIINSAELERMHGTDERISIKNLDLGSRIVAEVAEKTLCNP